MTSRRKLKRAPLNPSFSNEAKSQIGRLRSWSLLLPQAARAAAVVNSEAQRTRCLLLRVIKRDVVKLAVALDAEDYRIPGLQAGQKSAQCFQRVERRLIQHMQHVAWLQTKE